MIDTLIIPYDREMKISLMCLIILSSLSYAKDSDLSAHIAYLKGKVIIDHRDHKAFIAHKGDLLVEGDVLKVLDNSFAIIKYPDGSEAKIGADSEVEISKIHTHIEGEVVGESSLVMKYGHLILDIVNRGGEPAHVIHTHYAEFGVRGTRLLIAKNKSEEEVWASVEKGVVEVTHKKNPNHKEALLEKHGIVVTEKALTHPKEYSWVKKLNYDVQHKESFTGGFRKHASSRKKEFHLKKEAWKKSDKISHLKSNSWDKADASFLDKKERFKKELELSLQKRQEHRRVHVKSLED